MDNSQLALKMLEWEELQMKADALKEEIQDAVLVIGKTQNVGNIRATYSKGRKRYDYETAYRSYWRSGGVIPESLVNDNTKTVINYGAICKTHGIDDVPFTQSDPSVTVKLV